MRYYIYISNAKVSMLYDQIPPRLRDNLATELKIDVKLLSTTFREGPQEATLQRKLEIVTEYIEKDDQVGTIDKPKKYFHGIMRLRWGPYVFQDTNAVYFGGQTQHTIFGLIGSTKHVLGAMGNSQMDFSSSFVPAVMHVLSLLVDLPLKVDNDQILEDDYLSTIVAATESLKGPTQRLEFLSKKLIEGYDRDENKRVLLGTPLYVAIAE